jgi:DNA-nicking Smr family endonuclease
MPSATSTSLAKPKPPESTAPDDATLFRAAVGDVSPLPDPGRITPAPARVAPTPRRRTSDTTTTPDLLSDHVPHDSAADSELGFLRPGVAAQTLRRLRRGHWPITDEVDLHGMNRDAARSYLVTFLNHCHEHQAKCVRIIHGKGVSSKNNEPVLKQLVRNWLIQRPDVLAFVPAQPAEGGSGAVIVLLKRGK